jgi:uncharacterized membrane protein required for colicin V production
MEAIQMFLGGCVHNIEEIIKKLTTTLAVQVQAPHTDAFLDKYTLMYNKKILEWLDVLKRAETCKQLLPQIAQ